MPCHYLLRQPRAAPSVKRRIGVLIWVALQACWLYAGRVWARAGHVESSRLSSG